MANGDGWPIDLRVPLDKSEGNEPAVAGESRPGREGCGFFPSLRRCRGNSYRPVYRKMNLSRKIHFSMIFTFPQPAPPPTPLFPLPCRPADIKNCFAASFLGQHTFSDRIPRDGVCVLLPSVRTRIPQRRERAPVRAAFPRVSPPALRGPRHPQRRSARRRERPRA